MGTIKKETFQRLYTLFVISKFSDGAYGRVRLQKTVYEATKKTKLKPFEYLYYNHGQYSFGLADAYEQLLSMGYLTATPLDSRQGNEGNCLRLSSCLDKTEIQRLAGSVIGRELLNSTKQAVQDVGYQPQEILLKLMYRELEELKVKQYQSLFRQDIPDIIKVPKLRADECEDLELIFNPEFVSAGSRIAEAVSQTDFDLSKVKRVSHIGWSV